MFLVHKSLFDSTDLFFNKPPQQYKPMKNYELLVKNIKRMWRDKKSQIRVGILLQKIVQTINNWKYI